MRGIGGGLIALGLAALGYGIFGIDVTVEVSMPSSPYLPAMPSRVANLHAMHLQALVIQGGFAAIIAGTILFGLGAIDETLKARPTQTDAEGSVSEGGTDDEPASIITAVLGALAFFALIAAILYFANQPSASTRTDLSNEIMMGNDLLLDADTGNALDEANAALENADRAVKEAENALR